MQNIPIVIPAQAGIQRIGWSARWDWIPALRWE
jgi:hypothetical protein